MTQVITQRTKGTGQGPIVRLMSPSDLGQILKPFVFLDRFEVAMRRRDKSAPMPLHPGEGHIADLKRRLDRAGDRQNASGITPVFRG